MRIRLVAQVVQGVTEADCSCDLLANVRCWHRPSVRCAGARLSALSGSSAVQLIEYAPGLWVPALSFASAGMTGGASWCAVTVCVFKQGRLGAPSGLCRNAII